jgi:putative membrane protein
MRHRIVALCTALALVLISAACVRETPDEDMAAATETTATSATSTTGTLSATTTGSTGGSVSSMAPADKEFVIQAGFAGLAEVTLSQLALSRSENAEVKAFAQRMVTDHGRANEELQKLATGKGLALPTTLHDTNDDALKDLQSRGADFDARYVAQMAADHEKVIAEFENAERALADPDVRAFVTRTLPVLREHLQHVQRLRK